MKKLIISLLLIACLSIALVSGATTITHTWSGSGSITSSVVSDDDQTTTFATNGASIDGTLSVVDNNNNPYGYGVDTVSSYVVSKVNGGGNIVYEVVRTDSKSSMYGNAGQVMYTSAFSSNNVEIATGVTTNYAQLSGATYGQPKTTNGKNFEASGTYGIYHTIRDSDNDGAEIEAMGTGTALIDSMSSNSQGSSFVFGKGSGCFKNADSIFTGVGTFRVSGWADNRLNVDNGGLVIPGDGSDNSATYTLNIGYSGAFSYPDHSMDGN